MQKDKYSFFHLLKYDLIVGILLNWKKYLTAVCIFIVSALLFHQSILIYFDKIQVGLFDYILELFKGIDIYVPNSTIPFSIPGIWILLFLYFFYMVNNYPLADIHSYGQQVLLRSEKRLRWWFSKCLWLAMATIVFYVLGCFILLIFSFGTGSNPFLLHHEVNDAVTKLNTDYVSIQNVIYVGIVTPACVSMAIAFIQLIISFIANSSVTGYIAIIILLVASAYKCHPLLLGNYLMLKRSGLFISKGVSANIGIMLSAIVIGICVILGTFKIKHYDIIASKNK